MEIPLNIRSSQLSPLSKEHTDGLLFTKRIREGVNHAPVQQLRRYACWYWKNHIRPHFYQEERILLPYMPPSHPFAKKLKEDHADIRDLIISLDYDAEPIAFKALCDLIDKHVRFEEEQLFVYLEQHLGTAELDAIYGQLQDHPVHTNEWEERFWEN